MSPRVSRVELAGRRLVRDAGSRGREATGVYGSSATGEGWIPWKWSGEAVAIRPSPLLKTQLEPIRFLQQGCSRVSLRCGDTPQQASSCDLPNYKMSHHSRFPPSEERSRTSVDWRSGVVEGVLGRHLLCRHRDGHRSCDTDRTV